MNAWLTSVLDLAGLVLLGIAAVVLVWPFSIPGAVAVGGLWLLGMSWLIDRRGGGK